MNFTGGRKDTQAVPQLRCSTGWTSGIHGVFMYLSAFNVFLSITAVFGNILILVAPHKVSSLHPPSKLLFRCLATTDFCVGLITEPLSVVYWMFLTHGQYNLCRYAYVAVFIVSYTLCSVSLLTMSAIGVDRLLALLLGLKCRQVVTLKRTYLIVAIFWIISVVTSVSFLRNYFVTLWYGYIVIALCLVTSIASYAKIFLKLRHHQIQMEGHDQQEQPSQVNPLNIERYRKAVSSALWVQCTLVACYLPYGTVRALFSYEDSSPSRFYFWDLQCR